MLRQNVGEARKKHGIIYFVKFKNMVNFKKNKNFEIMKFKKITLTLAFAFFAQVMILPSVSFGALDDAIVTYIQQASPDAKAIVKDVIVLGTESAGNEGKKFKTIRFTRIAKKTKSIITMKLEYGKHGVGPESEILSVVNLTPKFNENNQERVNLYESGATNLFKPKKKSGG